MSHQFSGSPLEMVNGIPAFLLKCPQRIHCINDAGDYPGVFDARHLGHFLKDFHKSIGRIMPFDHYLVIESKLASFEGFPMLDPEAPCPPFHVLWRRSGSSNEQKLPECIRLFDVGRKHMIKMEYHVHVPNYRKSGQFYRLREDFVFIDKTDDALVNLLTKKLHFKHPVNEADLRTFHGASLSQKAAILELMLVKDRETQPVLVHMDPPAEEVSRDELEKKRVPERHRRCCSIL